MTIDNNRTLFKFLFEVYCLSLLIGQTLYFISPQLQFLRLFSVLFFVFFILYFNRFSVKKYLFYFFLLFFLYLTLILLSSTRNISFFYINALINCFMLFLIVFNLSVFFTKLEKGCVTKSLLKVIYIYLILCNLVAFWEILTQNHLPVSKFSDPDHNYILLYIPTTFFTNENDYMCVYLLLFLLVFSIKKDFLSERLNFFDFILLLLLTVQTFITGARIVQLCLILFFFIHFIQTKPKFLFFSIGVCFIFYLLYFDLINNTLTSSFSNHGSNEIRKNLYILALKSLFSFKSTILLGYGTDGAFNYYRNIKTELFLGGIEAPHNYLFEIILNAGFIYSLVFICAIFYIFLVLRSKKYYYFSSIVLLYFVILCASAASTFLWPQHIVLFVVFYYARSCNSVDKLKQKEKKKNYFLNTVFKYRGN